MGFLQAIAVGVLVAAALFVIQYSRVSIIRNALNGQNFHSNVDRPKAHRDLLNERGAEIHILRLQGFIFFGTIQAILNDVRRRLAQEGLPRFGYLVLDFQRVTRLDSSAVFGIKRLKQLTQASGVLMVWTQVSPAIQHQLERGGLVDRTDDTFIILPTLDHGVEWCENRILAANGTANLTAFVERLGTPAQAGLSRYRGRRIPDEVPGVEGHSGGPIPDAPGRSTHGDVFRGGRHGHGAVAERRRADRPAAQHARRHHGG